MPNKGRKPLNSPEEREAWLEMYERDEATTAEDVARHFNVPVHRVRFLVRTRSSFETDPFGEAASIVRDACNEALKHSGSMSQGEYEILTNIRREVS